MLVPIVMILGGILGGIVAQNKGRNLFFWTLLCGIMPLCIFILFALPKIAQWGVSRPCPFCLRIIPWRAKLCSYCGQRVPTPQENPCEFCGGHLWIGEDVCPHCGEKKSV